MPLYKYECQNCKVTSELLLKMSDPNPTECPECSTDEKDNMIKQLSRTNFVLKGTGWYETDFKDAKKPAAEDSSNSDTESKSDSDSDSAPKKSEGETPAKEAAPESSGSDKPSETAPKKTPPKKESSSSKVSKSSENSSASAKI